MAKARILTQAFLDSIKPTDKREEYPDLKAPGLRHTVQPSNARSWEFRFRLGKPRKLTLGGYPALGLAAARDRAAKARASLADGIDPTVAKKTARIAAKEASKRLDLVETVTEAFIKRYARRQTREKTWRETERLLTREVIGRWRGRRLSAISRADVHDLLDGIIDRGSPVVANRTLAALRRMCSWAEERGLVEASPCDKVRAPSVEATRDRILTNDEIRAAWVAFDAAGYPFGQLTKLLLLTGARLREVGSAQWTEFDFESKTWTLPKERSKNGVAHQIPLSDAALQILTSLPRIGQAKFLFTTDGKKPVGGYAFAKTRFDKFILAALREVNPDTVELTPWRVHDLRRVAASGMAGLGFPPHVVEAVLNHRGGTISGIARIYNRYNYEVEKRAALDAWARRLDAIINGAPAGNVVELAKARG